MGDVARATPDKLVTQIEHLYKKQAREIVSAAKVNHRVKSLREKVFQFVS